MNMRDGGAGFAVIYRWRLKPGSEEAFRAAWETVTRTICREHGGLGSRLHRTAEGLWLAYAQWPDRASWEALQSAPAADAVASGIMSDCVERRLEPILLEPVADLLVTTSPEAEGGGSQDRHDGSA
jgi:quinol monooxygenase YgiN